MKNVILQNAHTDKFCPKTTSLRINRISFPAFTLTSGLIAVFLTGCFRPEVQQTVYPQTVNTLASVYEDLDVGGTGLPWGVVLQVDPSALVPCSFIRVVDGDTIIVADPDHSDSELRIRLIGIDAPESVNEDESKNTEEGREASQFMRDLLTDIDTVYLEYDNERFDQYGRTLAYVWIDIGDTYIMTNEIMLATNHAEPIYIEPNIKYADTFSSYGD